MRAGCISEKTKAFEQAVGKGLAYSFREQSSFAASRKKPYSLCAGFRLFLKTRPRLSRLP